LLKFLPILFMKKVQENLEHKQKKSPDSSDFQNQDVRSPDMLIIMRACFVLLLAMCKTLNEQSLKIANLSNPSFPVITISPTQSPLPTSRPLHCSALPEVERMAESPCIRLGLPSSMPGTVRERYGPAPVRAWPVMEYLDMECWAETDSRWRRVWSLDV